MTLFSTIFDTDNWREIFATLSRNKTRTLMTAFGVFWGTAMLAMLWGGATGAEDLIRRNFQGFATNVAFVNPRATTMAYNGYEKGAEWTMTTGDVEQIARLDGIAAVTSVDIRATTAKYGRNTSSTQVQGVSSEYLRIFEPMMYAGRFINATDEAARRKVAVVGRRVADELFAGVPADSIPGRRIEANGIYYTVIGVAGQVAEASVGVKVDDAVIIPSSTMRLTYNSGDDVYFALFLADNGVSPTSLKPRIDRILRRNHAQLSPEDDPAIGFFDISEQFAMLDNVFTGFSLLALFVGLCTLIAGIIGVGNIMWVIVKERTREIGIRRAIGARPSQVIMQILSEAVVLTVSAGIVGIAFATLVLGIAAKLTEAPGVPDARFELAFSSAVVIVVAFVVLGSAAGLLPAIKAMRIKPVEAMNDV